jgi:hypothetical protein
MEFARVRMALAPNSFAQTLEVTAGVGPNETPLTEENSGELGEMVAELFARRRAAEPSGVFARRPARDPAQNRFAHDGFCARAHAGKAARGRAARTAQDPLYRAAPERWLESMLRQDLAPLTRSLAPQPRPSTRSSGERFANEADPDSIGNRAVAARLSERLTAINSIQRQKRAA